MATLPNKSQLLIFAAVIASVAAFAVPRLSGSMGGFAFADPSAAEVAVTPEDDGFFADGFDAVALPGASTPGTDSSGTTPPSSGLAASLENALARLERSSSAELPARAPRTESPVHPSGSTPEPDEHALAPRSSTATAAPEPMAGVLDPSSTNKSPAPLPPDPRTEERLRLARWLERVPLRGSILGPSGATLLVDGRRLAVGDALGAGSWFVARIEATTVEFSSGGLSVRVGLRDRRPSSRNGAVPAAPLPTEVREEGS